LRERRAWSVRELGERSGVSYVTISRVENGRMSPTVALLGKLARALGVPARDLLPAGWPTNRTKRRDNDEG
jgi:transcriptional regulator with XRE-family HTH domain